MRNLVLVLGDQLDRQSAAFDDFDNQRDAVWMAEVDEEATHVWCHKQRLVLFFSAMRHFRDELRERDLTVHYRQLQPQPSKDRGKDFATILGKDVKKLRPEKLIVVLPGDWRVREALVKQAERLEIKIEIRPDRHFYCDPDEFAKFAEGRKSLLLETFYRQMRKKHRVLVDDDQPVEGQWNFDHDNRDSFSKDGPGKLPRPHAFQTDELTESVMELVEHRFGEHPGTLDGFNMPVTHEQAMTMLRDFIDRGLPMFGKFEDAMWTGEPFVFHSRLSAPLNMKLLDPRDCIQRAVAAYEKGDAPINSVEGFVRQILGWREFIRGVYWLHMPGYIEMNHFDHTADVPRCFWDGDTEMKCVHESMQHVLRFGYAHHIHRLMVLGNFALLLGVDPRRFHDWHMAMYLDAVDWVSLPNTLGMSQHGDGGIVGTKPYVSTGNYIHKMSNFCRHCRFDYRQATGDDACPITTLYWDFLDRNYDQFSKNARMKMQAKHVETKRNKGEMPAIRQAADRVRESYA